jgi:hypothetical protein
MHIHPQVARSLRRMWTTPPAPAKPANHCAH